MGAEEDAVDAAADFIGPFLNRNWKDSEHPPPNQTGLQTDQLVEQALIHLQNIHTADETKDPDAPYDGSLVGVVYGLLDLITSLGILPFLPSGVAFAQRPKSVLISFLELPSQHNDDTLSRVLQVLISISKREGSGVQPLLTQRILPDIISAVATLAFSPQATEKSRSIYEPLYHEVLASASTSRLLPILTSFLQHDLPPWFRQKLSKELAMVPLRSHGVRHTVEFLSLSYLSKNSQMPGEAGGSLSQIPIPLEAITQASRLLASVPSDMNPDSWFTQLAPQLWTLLDGKEGVELSRASAQIIAGGILNRKSTGAPGKIGWELFVRPIHRAMNPEPTATTTLRRSTSDSVIVSEDSLESALRRLSAIVSSCSHSGLMKRLIGPVLLPTWGLMGFAGTRPSLDALWSELPRSILARYMSVACDPKQFDLVATNLFWDGETTWAFGPGAQGGVEIRARKQDEMGTARFGHVFARIQTLDERVTSLVSLLSDSNIDDEVVGAIFVRTTQRWLSLRTAEDSKTSLVQEEDINPLSALADAKLTETMATKFKDKFARSPQYVVELMSQLIQNFVDEHKAESKKVLAKHKPSRASLGSLLNERSQTFGTGMSSNSESDDLVTFALSILTTLITSSNFKFEASTLEVFNSVVPSLQYLSRSQQDLPVTPAIVNASSNLLGVIKPGPTMPEPQEDQQYRSRKTLKSILAELTAPDPPNRTWALSQLRKFIEDPNTFPLIDIPLTTHLLLSASIADAESYVHTAAIPVMVELAIRAPNPTLRILVDAFVDIDESSLRLKKERDIEQALDFRLRVGEILNNFVLEDEYWVRGSSITTRFPTLKLIIEALLSVASRRGQRNQTLAKRIETAELEKKVQEEGEAAWGGPIPNLLDPESENPAEQRERDALLKIVQGWEDTGIEEDARIRASALSILSVIMEKRLELLNQLTVEAGLQMVLQILVIETGIAKAILRRAAVLVVMGLLRGLDTLLGAGKEGSAGLDMRQAEEVDRVMKWARSEDGDELVRVHAENVVEGLETWRMNKLFRVRDEHFKIGASLGLEGNLRGLDFDPGTTKPRGGPVVEEIE